MTGVGIGMILDSAKSKIRFTAETFFQLVRCGPEGPPARRRTGGGSSVPLVGGLRWRTRIRGSLDDLVVTRNDGSRTSPRTVVDLSPGTRGVLGA